MAQEKPNRLVEWYLLIKRQAPVLREHLLDWSQAVREEPTLLWHTPAIRYAVYLLVGVLLVTTVGWGVNMLTPPPPPGAKPEATTADFHVLCTNPACGVHFAVRRPFGFDDFPVVCPHCHEKSGFAARRCPSPTCKGRWVVPERIDGGTRCPICKTPFP